MNSLKHEVRAADKINAVLKVIDALEVFLVDSFLLINFHILLSVI
jgi:hypothetical protein